MKPVVVLVGRPNVGKSTLFNHLSGSRQALVADVPGLSRDRLYAPGIRGDRPYLVVDTGGLSDWGAPTGQAARAATLEALMAAQVRQAVREADAVVLLTDGREGLTAVDRGLVEALRRQDAQVWLAVNKTEGMDAQLATADFHALGLGPPFPVSATRGDGVAALMACVLASLPRVAEAPATSEIPVIAIAGRPNVGKSTLVNALLGEERVVVFDQPGTTRDSVRVPLEHDGCRYELIDTAGVKRRARTTESIEKYSMIKTLQAIEAANVVILVVDARTGVVEQDALLAGFVLECGRAIVVAVNKWDGLEKAARDRVSAELDRKLGFLRFARAHLISARERMGLQPLFASVNKAFASARATLTTPKLNRVVQSAVRATAPPRARDGPVRLKFAHQGGRNPPLVVIHGTRVKSVPVAYRRYLSNAVRQGFDLEGTPVRIEFRAGDNPFAGRERTVKRRRRRRSLPA